MDVIKQIRSEMAAQGLNQRQIAERSGVGYVTISRMLSGKHEPTWSTLRAIAQALGKRWVMIDTTEDTP